MKTQIEIANHLKIKQPTWSNKLCGRRRISLDDAEGLTGLFGKDPVWWMKATPSEIRTAISEKKAA